MTVDTLKQIETYGPDGCETLSVEQARHWCRGLARRHYENFSVLTSLVPPELRDDFAAAYAFCRWADDLGDEFGSRERHRELLAWWRRELHGCYEGMPRHPVFVALRPTVERHDLPMKPFDDLIRAFEQDQEVLRYDTWEELLGYCRLSADPVGRLVLMICGEPRDEERFAPSDAICTALQLTNHWQDVNRDFRERGRIYIPKELNPIERFEERFAKTVAQGFGCDREFLAETRRVVRVCVERTWPLFDSGAALLERISPRTRPIVWLFLAGGRRVLRLIEQWGYETVLHRPRLSKTAKAGLVARAWIGTRLGSPNGRKGAPK